jgi:hypothetical protein
MTQSSYEEKKRRLSEQLRDNPSGIRLEKSTSNLFRIREKSAGRPLDVRQLNQVLRVDAVNQTVEVEGMTTYERLADACLASECMPLVVPQLKSITIGGAVSGIGIESTSFRHGLPHESVLDMEVLLPDGEVAYCTPDNNHSDLFFGIPNSYGTLGYILKLTARTMPVKPFVALEHIRHTNIEDYFNAVAEVCQGDADFVDGTVFSEDEMYLTLGRFTDNAPYTSDYTWLDIYYRSIQRRSEDYLKIRRPPSAQLHHLSEDHALEQPRWTHRRTRQSDGSSPRERHPGRGHPDREGAGVSSLLSRADRHPPGMDLPHRRSRSVAKVSFLSSSRFRPFH